MNEIEKIKKDISDNIKNREYTANKHVMKCFTIAMFVYFITFVLNVLDIFIIDKNIMKSGVIPSIIIYAIVLLVTKRVSLFNSKIKYKV